MIMKSIEKKGNTTILFTAFYQTMITSSQLPINRSLHQQKVFDADNHVHHGLSASNPHDGAVIITDEKGNIQSCNAEAQSIFHCLPSYSQSKKLSDIFSVVLSSRKRYTPTLCELAFSTRRPLAFPDVMIVMPSGEKQIMDVCTLWLHESREGHLHIAYIFSSPVKNPLCKRNDCHAEHKDSENQSGAAEGVDEGIIVLRKHIIIDTSQMLDSMLGYKEGEILGHDISDLLSDTDAANLMYAIKKHDTSLFQGLVMRKNHFLTQVGFRSFHLTNTYSDVIVTRLYSQ